MPAFTLYGARGSTNTDRVRLTLAEGGFTDYELVLLDMRKGEHKSPEHFSRHPFGKLPALSTPSGFTFHESRAICLYLCRKYNLPLIPDVKDLEATALFDQAASIETTYFAAPAGVIAFECFVKKLFMKLEPDNAVVEKARGELKGFFEVMDGLLERNGGFMGGATFGLVDVFYVPVVRRLVVCGQGDLVEKGQNVKAWWERCTSRPAVKEVLGIE